MTSVNDPPPLPLSYATPPSRRPPEHLRMRPILRDVGIIFALTFFGGCVVGMSGMPLTTKLQVAIVIDLCNLALGTAGFTLSGCRAPKGNRWPHLAYVALGVWIISIANAIASGGWLSWLFSCVRIAVMMGIGGAFSMAIVKHHGA